MLLTGLNVDDRIIRVDFSTSGRPRKTFKKITFGFRGGRPSPAYRCNTFKKRSGVELNEHDKSAKKGTIATYTGVRKSLI